MENEFLGQGWAFPPEFESKGGEVKMVSGEEDIKQSLQILLSTSLKERIMHSGYGCDLSRFLFEEADEALVNGLSNKVSRAILMNEPRIEVNEILVEGSDLDNGLILISVNYTVRTTNNRFNLVYPFYLNEGSAAAFEL